MAGSFINLKMLNSALDDVRDELGELDLLTERLDEVDVILTPFHPGTIYGYYVEDTNWLGWWLGWEDGNISFTFHKVGKGLGKILLGLGCRVSGNMLQRTVEPNRSLAVVPAAENMGEFPRPLNQAGMEVGNRVGVFMAEHISERKIFTITKKTAKRSQSQRRNVDVTTLPSQPPA